MSSNYPRRRYERRFTRANRPLLKKQYNFSKKKFDKFDEKLTSTLRDDLPVRKDYQQALQKFKNPYFLKNEKKLVRKQNTARRFLRKKPINNYERIAKTYPKENDWVVKGSYIQNLLINEAKGDKEVLRIIRKKGKLTKKEKARIGKIINVNNNYVKEEAKIAEVPKEHDLTKDLAYWEEEEDEYNSVVELLNKDRAYTFAQKKKILNLYSLGKIDLQEILLEFNADVKDWEYKFKKPQESSTFQGLIKKSRAEAGIVPLENPLIMKNPPQEDPITLQEFFTTNPEEQPGNPAIEYLENMISKKILTEEDIKQLEVIAKLLDKIDNQ